MQAAKPLNSTPAFRSILVLCEANHCRSAIAECLLRASLSKEINVESAGFNALIGFPADSEAQQVTAEHGLDLSHHRGRQLTAAMVLSADLVLVMEQAQKDACEELVPSARGRIFLLGHWLSRPLQDISDPFHRGPASFRSAFEIIQQSVESWLPCLVSKLRSA